MNESDLTAILSQWSAALVRRSMHDFLHFARRSGLSMAQMNVLTHLYYRGSCEISALLGTLEVSKAGAGQLVERMEQQGLVDRTPDPHDRRARVVSLTEKGEELVRASISARQAWMKDIIERVPEEQRAAVGEALRTLTQAAAALEGDPFAGKAD